MSLGADGGALLFKAAGWLGQGFFFFRFLLQWIASERARRIVVPLLFWQLSIAGNVLALTYAAWKRDPVMIAGNALTLFIYPRNLWLVRTGRPLRGGLLLAIGLGLAGLAAFGVILDLRARFLALPAVWKVVGGVGQTLWASRFVVQWWVSERRGRSVLPTAFFVISLAGSVLLLAYTIWTGDAVFIAGQALTPFLNARSLVLARRGAAAGSA